MSTKWRGKVVRALGAFVLLTGGSVHAAADAGVDEVRRSYEEADFAGALEAFDRALATGDLDRADLVRLLELRALVHLALDATEAYEADLERIASLDPDHGFGANVPPDVTEAFARIRTSSPGPLRLSASVTAAEGGVTVEARVDRDPGSLVRELRVFGRPRGGSWAEAADSPLLVRTDALVEYYAVALGPGGVVVANVGSEEEPRTTRAAIRPTPESEAPGGHDAAPIWPWIVGSTVAAVTLAVVITVVLVASAGEPGSSTQPAIVWGDP